MPSTRYLVLIETAGNQGFIFATNKLRENVGASQMTHDAGTTFVETALRKFNVSDKDILVMTSGKAMFLVETEDQAKKIIGQVTKTALAQAPGLDLRGAFVVFDVAEPATIHNALKQVHERHAELASFVPGPRERFLRLPVVADCATSGLPAMMMGKDGEKMIPISKVTLAKREAAKEGWERMRRVAGVVTDEDDQRLRLAPGPDALDSMDLEWLAVIHADGNGFGTVFLNFVKHLRENTNRLYAEKLKEFSDGLDICTREAFRTALGIMASSWSRKNPNLKKYLPVVPLVLGGDDLTIVCDGRYAVQLARDFLRTFEIAAQELAQRIGLVDAPRFGACAGVAIVKPHYPFYAAYDLAEELLRSAKKMKPFSALDFHILYDASSSKLETIRNKLGLRRFVKPDGSVDYRTKLVARPYIVTPNAEPKWRHTDDLDRRVRLVRGSEDGPRPLPRGMLHELREGLFLGVEVAEARLRLARGRHAEALDTLLPEQRLFFQDGADHSVTSFLDALDLAEFWETEDQS